MDEIVIKIKIPEEFEELKEKIENLINREAEEIIKKLAVLKRAKGCLKTEKSWQELEAELYEDAYR
jgi:FtsZ-binding cell division protein ZapB